MAVDYFKKLYTKEGILLEPFSIRNRFPQLSVEDINFLSKDVSLEEVRQSVFGIDPLKAPGIDGFHMLFFQNQWGVVRNSLLHMIQDIFNGSDLLDNMNKTMLVLIPKVDKPKRIAQLGL